MRVKYKTAQDERERFFAPSGSRTADIYKHEQKPEKLSDGTVVYRDELVKVGETDVYAKIQEARDDCDVYKILDRAACGDIVAMRKVQGAPESAYVDIRGIPKNIHEVKKQQDAAINNFQSLPEEIRAAFGNDPVEFVKASADKEKFAQPFIDFYKKYTESKKTEPKKEDKAE